MTNSEKVPQIKYDPRNNILGFYSRRRKERKFLSPILCFLSELVLIVAWEYTESYFHR